MLVDSVGACFWRADRDFWRFGPAVHSARPTSLKVSWMLCQRNVALVSECSGLLEINIGTFKDRWDYTNYILYHRKAANCIDYIIPDNRSLNAGDYLIPPGCDVTISAYALHRNPRIYNDPYTFNPDRFFPENSIGRHPYAYIPFSAGSRNCIGQRFAMAEEKVVLSTLLRHFKFALSPLAEKPKPSTEITLKSMNGIHLLVSRRWAPSVLAHKLKI